MLRKGPSCPLALSGAFPSCSSQKDLRFGSQSVAFSVPSLPQVLLCALAAAQAAPQFLFVLPHDFSGGSNVPLQAIPLDQTVSVSAQLPAAPAEEAPAEAEVVAEAAEAAPEAAPEVAEATPEAAEVAEAAPEAAEAAPETVAEAAEAAPEAAPAGAEAAPEAAEAAPEAAEAEAAAPASEPAPEAAPEAAVAQEAAPAPEAAPAATVDVAVAEPAVAAPAASPSLPTLGTPAVTTKLRTDPSSLNLVDPLGQVEARFRPFIYPNDSPDVVAAKVALFRLHASRHPLAAASPAPAPPTAA